MMRQTSCMYVCTSEAFGPLQDRIMWHDALDIMHAQARLLGLSRTVASSRTPTGKNARTVWFSVIEILTCPPRRFDSLRFTPCVSHATCSCFIDLSLQSCLLPLYVGRHYLCNATVASFVLYGIDCLILRLN